MSDRAAILSLSNELLSMIFEVVCDSIGFPCEITLSHVSQHWRGVALCNPRLWTVIRLKPQKALCMPQAYVTRSRALPLHLHVGSHKSSLDEIDISLRCRTLEKVTHIIRHCADRCHHLRVDSRYDLKELAEVLKPLASPPVTLPLRTVRIDMYCRGTDDEDSEIMKNFSVNRRKIFESCGPFLASLALRGLGLQTLFITPLVTLVSLQLHDPSFVKMSLASMASVLNKMAALKHLVINGDLIDEWMPGTHILLPSLQSLQLRMHLILLPDILDIISAPVLHSLLLENVFSKEIEVFTQKCLPSRSEAKFPSLRSLTLIGSHNEWIDSSAWIGLFLAFPLITEFALSYASWRSFLTSLCTPVSLLDKHNWSQLDTLSLVYRPDTHAKWYSQSLHNALSKRISCGHPIRCLQLSKTIMTIVKDDLEVLQSLAIVEEHDLYSEDDFKFFLSWSDTE